MNENIITMGSSIIDFYMEGFEEGKNDDFEAIKPTPTAKKHRSVKERASTRRKKAYFKSRSRMVQLDKVGHYIPDEKDEAVVMGMLRSHQLPIAATIRCDNPCGSSIGNKKRMDAAEQHISEYRNSVQDDVCA